MPSCTARLTSLAQTSFWKSTNAFARRSARMAGGCAIARRRTLARRSADSVGSRDSAPRTRPPVAAARPAASPSASAPARSKAALQAPADRSRCADAPGLKSLQRLVEGELAARLREEMHRGRPSARHQQRVAGDGSLLARKCLKRTALTRRRPSTPRISAPATTSMPAARAASGSGPLASRRRSAISATLTPAVFEIERGAVGAVVRGRDDDAVADLGAILAAIAPRGIGEHHGRPVVVREDQRALDRAGRQHHLARAHLPQAFARQIGIGDEVGFGDALVERDEILRVIAERLGARHQPHVGRGPQRGERVRKPIRARFCPRSRPQPRRAASRPSAGFSSQTTTRAPLALAASAAASPAGPAPTISTSQWSNVR